MNKQMKKSAVIYGILVVIFTLISAVAKAAGGGHGDDYIPWGKIAIQVINLGILLTVLFFFARKSVVAAFAQKRTDFVEQSQKTERALKQAEAALREAKERLKDLESGEAHSISAAAVEAEATKNKIVREAEAQATKIKGDVQMLVGAELYKARAEIRQQIIEKSIAAAESNIKQSSATITQKSESGFLQDLGQVKA